MIRAALPVRLPGPSVAGGRAMVVAAGERVVSVALPSPPPSTQESLFGSQGMTIAIIALQAVGLVGATVTGTLARKRRIEMEKINTQLREINAKLRDQSFDEQIIPTEEEIRKIQEYRAALESSTDIHTSAEEVQLYEQREQLLNYIRQANTMLDSEAYDEALEVLKSALALSNEAGIHSATRAVLRVKGRVLKAQGKLEETLACLQKVLAVSIAMEEFSGDADVFGEIADLYTQLGDMEQAAEYYDRCIAAIGADQPSQLSSTWDMA
eukprot:CAMPEP_0117677702 /NCGR_PEP_ID=MMETSP0804-20121206/16885_1 /TAXON_ID=1074897 /ORGANISM="Tetraselmis astigmatica, Strain CCMP880" /LENGTH=267 /DNA_ID=CAMNT_0005487001 /DNA_START=38 /DNA_END=841 /DNA_ORIENTATION=-